MSCPKCRTDLVIPSKDQEELDEWLYCPPCDVFYGQPLHLKGILVNEVGCLDEENNVFFARAGANSFIVKQPRHNDHEDIKEALKLASEYTFLRYPSNIWRHPEGICNLPLYKRGSLGTLYLMMVLNKRIVGFSHHTYWTLDKENKEKEGFPVPVGSKMALNQLCVLDPYQKQGVGSLYAKVSDYISLCDGADFVMGETFKEGGMLNIRLKDGWMDFGERIDKDGTTRILIGKPIGV